MNRQTASSNGSATEVALRKAQSGSPAACVTAVTILLLAGWIGLTAGFIDLGLMVMKSRWIDRDFYRLGGNFVWLIPAGVTGLVFLLAVMLVVVARIRGRSVRLKSAVGLLSFIGFLDMTARLPLALGAVLLLSGGLAVQLAYLVNRHRLACLHLARRMGSILAGVLLTLMVATIGGRAWSEHLAMAALPSPPPKARNVLLIVWDTVRAGNLSLHGYGRPTTPNLERLALRGVRFDLAFSTSSWTLPAHASMFTGQWPHDLGVDWKSPLRDDVPTLAEYLSSRGYDTAGFAANLDYCSRETGLARGFAHYEDYPLDLYDTFNRYLALGNRFDIADSACALGVVLERFFKRSFDLVPRAKEHVKNAAAVDHAFLDWLTGRQGRRRPFFAFLNYNDAHIPYEVPDRSAAKFGLQPETSWDRVTMRHWNTVDKTSLTYRDAQMALDLYDDSIAYLDRRLEFLLQELKERGVLDDTLVIVTADHGEHLGDHFLFFHGGSLYRQLVQVPLVIVGPKAGVPANRAVAPPVSLRDIPATIVDLLGLNRDSPFLGRSLISTWSPDQATARTLVEPLLMETSKPPLLTNQGREPAAKGPMKSLVAEGMHYIYMADGIEELYSLKSDPEERLDLALSPSASDFLQRFRNGLAVMLKRRLK